MPQRANQTSFKKGQAAWNKRFNSESERYQAYRPQQLVRTRARAIRVRFGISAQEYEQRKKAAEGQLCPICLQPMVTQKRLRGTSGISPVLDHDEKTKRIREFVHRNCNAGMGLFDHDPVKLRRAADYLEKHRAIE